MGRNTAGARYKYYPLMVPRSVLKQKGNVNCVMKSDNGLVSNVIKVLKWLRIGKTES